MNLVDRYQRAQQPATPVIGFLSGGSSAAFAPYLRAFWQGLGEAGFVDGRNIAIEYRWAEGRLDHLPEMAADLVRRQVALIAATPGRNRQTSLRCCCSIALDLMFNQGRFQPRKPCSCRGRCVHCSRPSVLTRPRPRADIGRTEIPRCSSPCRAQWPRPVREMRRTRASSLDFSRTVCVMAYRPSGRILGATGPTFDDPVSKPVGRYPGRVSTSSSDRPSSRRA